MTQPHRPTNSDNTGASLQHVHELGGVIETWFNRLYGGLNRSKRLSKALSQLDNLETRNRKLRQALDDKTIETQQLSGILASISEGVILQDTEGRIVLINDAAHDILGSEKYFWRSPLKTMFREQRQLASVESGIVPLGKAQRVKINDRTISAQLTALTAQDNERIGTLMILRDETDTLSENMKNSFVTQISHELITPLNPMRVASEILLNTPEGKAPNRRMLEMISRNVDVLDRLVREMLDMSAMTSGNFQIKRETILLEDIVFDVVESFKPDIDAGELEIFLMLRDSENLTLIGDQKNLRWALSNLLRNAIQYTNKGGSIWVTVGVASNHPQQLQLEVADTGVGINDDDLERIFELFYRGDARDENGKKLDPRGLGQGLFVARTIIEAHGGALTVDSIPQDGTTVSLTLPRNMPRSLPS